MNLDERVTWIVNTSIYDGLMSAQNASLAVIRRAVQVEESRPAPRISLIRGLKTELRKKERAAAAAPKDAA